MELSEEQIVTRLFDLENAGEADRRAQLAGERYMSLVEDDATGRAYVFRHGVDNTEGGTIPVDTEFWEYGSFDEAERVYNQMLGEARRAGELVDEDSDEDLGDFETAGAELRDERSSTDDPLVTDEPEP